MAFSRGWRRRRRRLRGITRAADRSAFTGPVERRPELSTKVKLTRRAPPPVACYLIVLLARHDAPSWSRFLLSPSAHPLIPPLRRCSFVRTLVLLRHRYFSPPPSFHRHLLASCAPTLFLSLFPATTSCSFHRALGEPPNLPVNRPREATIVEPPLLVEILWNFISALFCCYRDERASLQRRGISVRQRISGYDLHNRIIRRSLYRHITNVLFINQLCLCTLHWNS